MDLSRLMYSQPSLSLAIDQLNMVARMAKHQEESKEEEDDSRMERRRQQIAAASRKSRAKRKRETESIKEENANLFKELMHAKKRLKDLNQDVTSLDEFCSNFSDALSDSSSVNDNKMESGKSDDSSKSGSESLRTTIVDFISSRLSLHFNQLKQDALLFARRTNSTHEQLLLKSVTDDIRFQIQ